MPLAHRTRSSAFDRDGSILCFVRRAGALALLALAACQDSVLPTAPARLSPANPQLVLTGANLTEIFPIPEFRPPVRGDARGLNNSGQVTGMVLGLSALDIDFSAYRWTPGAGIVPLTGCCDTRSGNDINDAGVITGRGQWNLQSRAYRAIGTTMTILSVLPGNTFEQSAMGLAINASGQIVGWSDVNMGYPRHAALWSPTDVIQDLGTLGGSNSAAIDINASGQVIGTSQTTGDAVTRFFLWSASTGMQDLTLQLGALTDLVEINDAGQIAGTYVTAGGASHAFLYTPSSGLRDLGTLGGSSSSARGLNNKGQVVGSSTLANGATRAFLWTPTDGMEDITAITGVAEVRRLNDNLQTVTGTGPPGFGIPSTPISPKLVQLTVTQNAAPVARFTSSCTGVTCSFDATTSSDDKGIVSYAWNLGKFPGGSATGPTVNVTYPHSGPRTVKLTVTDASGLTSNVTKTFDVGAPPPPPVDAPPVARFTWSCAGATCTFNATTSTDDKGIVSYTWDLNKYPGGAASGAVVTAGYPHSGTRNVKLTVKDASGQSSSVTQSIVIP